MISVTYRIIVIIIMIVFPIVVEFLTRRYYDSIRLCYSTSQTRTTFGLLVSFIIHCSKNIRNYKFRRGHSPRGKIYTHRVYILITKLAV